MTPESERILAEFDSVDTALRDMLRPVLLVLLK